MKKYLYGLLMLVFCANANAIEVQDARDLIQTLKYNSKLHKLNVRSFVVLQGTQTALPEPAFTLINDEIVGIVNNKKHHVKYAGRPSYLRVVGSPDRLTIHRLDDERLKEIAIEKDAEAIFLWHLIEHPDNLFFTAKVIALESGESIWTYQKDLKTLREEQDNAETYDGPFEVPQYRALTLAYLLDLRSYSRESNGQMPNTKAENMQSFEVGYLASADWNPKFSFHPSYAIKSQFEGELTVNMEQYLVGLRYQLNAYKAPTYDSSNGRIVKINNRQKHNIELSAGLSKIDMDGANSKHSRPTVQISYIASFTDSLDMIIGISHISSKIVNMRQNQAYTNNSMQLGGSSAFIGFSYRLSFDSRN